MIESFDISLFHWLNGLLHQSWWGDKLILFFAQYYVFIVGIIFVIAIYKLHKGQQERWYVLVRAGLITLIARFAIMPIIYLFDQRLRPYIVLQAPHLFAVNAYAFPSGHTTFAFAIATIAWYYHEKTAYFLYISGFAIGIARVMAGVHYPSDILGGIVVGTLSAYILMELSQTWFPPHKKLS